MFAAALKLIWSPIGRAILAGVGIALGLFLAYRWAYNNGHHAAEMQCAAERAAALAQAIERKAEIDANSAAATETLQDNLAVKLPAIEEEAHEATERIRTVYRDVPVPADCSRPADVLREISAARDRANAAAGAMRGGSGSSDSPGSD